MWKESEMFKGYIENTDIDLTRNKEGYVVVLEKGKEIYKSCRLKKALTVYMQLKYKETI